MDSRERKLARAIAPCRVRYLPGSSDKRFAACMYDAAQAAEPGPTLSLKQRAYLVRLALRYRRQISPLMVQLALSVKAEDCGLAG